MVGVPTSKCHFTTTFVFLPEFLCISRERWFVSNLSVQHQHATEWRVTSKTTDLETNELQTISCKLSVRIQKIVRLGSYNIPFASTATVLEDYKETKIENDLPKCLRRADGAVFD